MMNSFFLCSLLLVLYAFVAESFRPITVNRGLSRLPYFAVAEVASVEEFDAILKENPDKLVVIDYSTTWCGPCKIAFPKFEEMSNRYDDVIFVKCIGDSTAEAGKLMKREKVRSVPAFHFWKNGVKAETISGARMDEIEASIKSMK